MCNIGPHLAFALDVRSKGFGRACPSLSTRVICHNIADSKLCSTKGYFVQLLVKSHHCFCWRDLEAEYLYLVSQSTIYTECIRYITFFVHLLVFQRLHTHQEQSYQRPRNVIHFSSHTQRYFIYKTNFHFQLPLLSQLLPSLFQKPYAGF